jgi:hypothetical protein
MTARPREDSNLDKAISLLGTQCLPSSCHCSTSHGLTTAWHSCGRDKPLRDTAELGMNPCGASMRAGRGQRAFSDG